MATLITSPWSNGRRFSVKVEGISAELAKLVASDATAGDYFGDAVAVSGDGGRVVVGASMDDISANDNAGSVHVYKKNGASYTHEVKMTAIGQAVSAALNVASGSSVRIQTNSASLSDQTYTSSQSVTFPADATAVTITGLGGPGYSASGGYWTLSSQTFHYFAANWGGGLRASGTPPPYAPSNSGQTATDMTQEYVPANGGYNIYTETWTGTVYINNYPGTATTVTIKDRTFTFAGGYGGAATASTQYFYANQDDRLGYSVAISNDGAVVAAGAFSDNLGSTAGAFGSVAVAQHNGTAWLPMSVIPSPDTNTLNQHFGNSVSLDANGIRLAIGAPIGVGAANKAYIYTRSGSTWTQEAVMTSDGTVSNGVFGESVALSADGATLLVSERTAHNSQGAVNVYVRSGTTWSRQAKLIKIDTETGDDFGYSIALSGDGNTALVGAYASDRGGLVNSGVCYVFTRSGVTWSQQAELLANGRIAGEYFGHSVSLNSDGNLALIGATGNNNGALNDSGASYLFSRTGTTWAQVGKLTASDAASSDKLGGSVALSSDKSTAVIGTEFKNSNTGSAYVFI